MTHCFRGFAFATLAHRRWTMANVVLPASIESIVSSNNAADLILNWSAGLRADELTVEDIEDRFAALDVSETDLPNAVQKRIVGAQRELDAIR